MIKPTVQASIDPPDSALDPISNDPPGNQARSGQKLPFVKPQLTRQGDLGAITRFQIGGSDIDPFDPFGP